MQQPPRRGEPEIDLEEIWNRISATFRRILGGRGGGPGPVSGASRYNPIALVTIAILGVALIIWLATGTFQVSPGEVGVHRTFGKCCHVTDEGLHWWWPAPIGTKAKESTERIRSMELGFSSKGGVSPLVLQDEAQMIAGDLNIVDVPLVIQYRIADPQSFLFNVSDPGDEARGIPAGKPEGRTLKDATEAALRLVVGQRSIDDVLTNRKEEVQAETHEILQSILDRYETGIQILEVRLQEVSPPSDVLDAFQDVNRARQDKETAINEAEAFARDIIPRTEGTVERVLRGAEAFKQQRIRTAEGEAERFLSILRAFEQSREVTRQRLYLEAMAEILPGVSKFIVSPEAQGSIVLNAGGAQVIPLPGILPTATPSPSTQTTP